MFAFPPKFPLVAQRGSLPLKDEGCTTSFGLTKKKKENGQNKETLSLKMAIEGNIIGSFVTRKKKFFVQ